MENYAKRPGDVNKAVRIPRKNRVPIGVPMLRADGEMLFPVNDLTITATQLLELFDNRDLNITAVRKIAVNSGSRSD